MDETQISITVKPIYLERLLYWIIIIVLAVLLALAWMDDDNADTTTPSDSKGAVTTPPAGTGGTTTPPPQETTATPEPPKETCTDGTKNQDETDVDCGGVCTKCGSGKACSVAADCIGGYCVSGKCTSTAPVVLSGEVDLLVTNAKTTESASGALKLTSVSYKVTNGLDKPQEFIAKLFIRKAGSLDICYNQLDYDTECNDPYAEFSIGSLKSGASVTKTDFDLKDYYRSPVGNYIVDSSAKNPATFQVVIYLYDEDGNEINEESISDSFLVK